MGIWQYVNKLLMYLWLCSDRSQCFLQSRAIHTWILDIISTSFCTWQALGPGISASLRLLLEELQFIYVVIAPWPFALGNLDAACYSFCKILDSTVDTCSSSVLGGYWTNFRHFLCEGELGSCGRFTSCSSGLQHGEVCTVDASITGLPALITLEIWTLFPRASCI